MCLSLVTLFRRFFNGQGRFGRFLSRQSYAVYILHIPTVVFLAIAMRTVELPSLPKFGADNTESTGGRDEDSNHGSVGSDGPSCRCRMGESGALVYAG
jgi:hypothetical protein